MVPYFFFLPFSAALMICMVGSVLLDEPLDFEADFFFMAVLFYTRFAMSPTELLPTPR